jgi:hypothetical protein
VVGTESPELGAETYNAEEQAEVDRQLGVPKNAPTISRNPRDVTYMFRVAPGHVRDLPTNRSNLRNAAARGTVFRELSPNTVRKAWIALGGQEWWVTQRGSIIVNGGMNQQPFFLREP